MRNVGCILDRTALPQGWKSSFVKCHMPVGRNKRQSSPFTRDSNRMTRHQKRDPSKHSLFDVSHAPTISATIQESTSCRSGGTLKSVRLPLFVVEIAYAEGDEELATSSKNAFVDPSELVVVNPSENEFHTRLEVCSSPECCERRSSSAGLSKGETYLHQSLEEYTCPSYNRKQLKYQEICGSY